MQSLKTFIPFILILEHTVQWKPPGMEEEPFFEDVRDQVHKRYMMHEKSTFSPFLKGVNPFRLFEGCRLREEILFLSIHSSL